MRLAELNDSSDPQRIGEITLRSGAEWFRERFELRLIVRNDLFHSDHFQRNTGFRISI